ncbi:DUF1489 family protein [Neomegalonema perideroedes]|uniref:DUF1489 family protein n=1 Tax=Neomegalonema perideroedes TaxID=217219 RepID=UPI00037A4BA5|nr:DUF1489 domain-containing protein [Neomegalonema perideroedes]
MLHLVKLCVGVDTIEEFFSELSEAEAADSSVSGRAPPWRFRHVTRQTPRRSGEILAGGSLYWVISGRILCRQRIVGLEPLRGEDGIERCAILLSREAWRTRPAPRRPFQGWRYLEAKDAPSDLGGGDSTEAEALPDDLLARLGDFGVL